MKGDILIRKEDLRLTLLACFRYSLGRRTYIVGHTTDMIKQYERVFREWDWKLFIKEINQYYKDFETLGDKCDEANWNELKMFAEQKIDELYIKIKIKSPGFGYTSIAQDKKRGKLIP